MFSLIVISVVIAVGAAIQLAYDLGRGKRSSTDMVGTLYMLGGSVGMGLTAFLEKVAGLRGAIIPVIVLFVGFVGGVFGAMLLYDRLFLTPGERVP